jgi:glycosyltransferase involved in cell wall biosynthesis
MKKKILILCQYFYPEYISSAVLPTQLAEYLVESGFEVSVICGWPKKYHDGNVIKKKEKYNGINIYRMKYINFNNNRKFGRIINFFSYFVSNLLRLPKIIKNKVVLVYSNPPILPLIGYWAKKMSKLKLVFIGFDLYPDNAIALDAIKEDGLISKIMNYVNKRVYFHSDRVIAISSDMKNYMLKKHKDLEEKKTVVIPNWYGGEIEPSKIIKNEEFKKLRVAYQLIVLYSGNLGEAQELDTIVDSIVKMYKTGKNKNVLFVFTGHGSKKEKVEEKLFNLGIDNTRFYGFLKDQAYKDVLNISDVCLVSLKKGIEGLGVPSKIYGYLAYGKPVLSIMSHETEIAKNLISYNAGFNIVQNNVDGFIDTIENFLVNDNLLKECTKNSYRLYDDLYKKSISLEKYSNMIYSIIE